MPYDIKDIHYRTMEGDLIFAEGFMFSRLWAIGQPLVHDSRSYVVRRVAVADGIQHVNVEPWDSDALWDRDVTVGEVAINPAETYEALMERLDRGNICERAVAIALRDGQVHGDHHKSWVIDQILRILAGSEYTHLVAMYEQVGERNWGTGQAP